MFGLQECGMGTPVHQNRNLGTGNLGPTDTGEVRESVAWKQPPEAFFLVPFLPDHRAYPSISLNGLVTETRHGGQDEEAAGRGWSSVEDGTE